MKEVVRAISKPELGFGGCFDIVGYREDRKNIAFAVEWHEVPEGAYDKAELPILMRLTRETAQQLADDLYRGGVIATASAKGDEE